MKQILLIVLVLITSLNSYSAESEKIENPPGFSKELLDYVDPVYQAILKHPFVTGLVDGTLPKDKFQYFLIQNDLYLKKFAKSQALLATRAPKNEWALHFVDNSLFALVGERDEYGELFKKWGIDVNTVDKIRQSPTGLAYSSYEFATIQEGSFAEGFAALLPCYVLYRNMGKYFVETQDIKPLYKDWLYSYAGEDYGKVVDSTLLIFDEAVRDLPAEQKQRIKDRFYTSCLFEWMFFEAAWERQEWPKL